MFAQICDPAPTVGTPHPYPWTSFSHPPLSFGRCPTFFSQFTHLHVSPVWTSRPNQNFLWLAWTPPNWNGTRLFSFLFHSSGCVNSHCIFLAPSSIFFLILLLAVEHMYGHWKANRKEFRSISRFVSSLPLCPSVGVGHQWPVVSV